MKDHFSDEELSGMMRDVEEQLGPAPAPEPAPVEPRGTDGWWLYGEPAPAAANKRSAIPMRAEAINSSELNTLPRGCTYNPIVAVRWVRDGMEFA